MIRTYLAVMAVGAFGCAARMALSQFCAARFGENFPTGTLVVNITGCFLIGVFVAITRPDGGLLLSPVVRQAVIFGFLGGFTTFSSFAMQTLSLAREGEWLFAGLNVGLSVVLCLVAAWLGHSGGLLITKG